MTGDTGCPRLTGAAEDAGRQGHRSDGLPAPDGGGHGQPDHLAQAKARALEYADRGQVAEALSSFASDLGSRPETAGHPAIDTMRLLAEGDYFTAVPGRLRQFIENVR